MVLTTLEKGSVTEKVLGESTPALGLPNHHNSDPFYFVYQRCPQHQGQKRKEGCERENILFFHAVIPKTQPFNLKHPFYFLKCLQVNKFLHSFPNPASLIRCGFCPLFLALR